MSNSDVGAEEGLLDRFPAMRRLVRGERRIPFVHQLSATECGAACLAMVLGYHGKEVRLEELRESTGSGRDGATAARRPSWPICAPTIRWSRATAC